MQNYYKLNWVFCNQAESATDENTLLIQNGCEAANIYISGTATSVSYKFQGMDDDNNYYDIMCANLKTLTTATSGTDMNSVWQADLTALRGFRVVVDSVSGGYVTIKAKVVGSVN